MTDGTDSNVDQDYGEWSDWFGGDAASFRVRVSSRFVVVHDHYMPSLIELISTPDAEPRIFAQVEVDESGPSLREFAFTSHDPKSKGIRQADFRAIQVSALVEDLVALWTIRIDRDEDGNVVGPTNIYDDRPGLTRFVGQMRMGRTSRDITPQLLERVAEVYRENIAGHPTKAVEHHFQVSQRMAAEYVSRARKRGLLPPTKKGKKNA